MFGLQHAQSDWEKLSSFKFTFSALTLYPFTMKFLKNDDGSLIDQISIPRAIFAISFRLFLSKRV